jgi:hypothetical protein
MKNCILLLVILILAGCSAPREQALKPALQYGWQQVRMDVDPNLVQTGDKAFEACLCPDLPLVWQMVRPEAVTGSQGLQESKAEVVRLLDELTELYCREAE